MQEPQSAYEYRPVIVRPKAIQDARGTLVKLLDPDSPFRAFTNEQIVDIEALTSKEGTVRGNHYHPRGWKAVWVLDGGCIAATQPVPPEQSNPPEYHSLAAGDMILIPPNTAHAFKFTEDSIIVAYFTALREGNVARHELIPPSG